MMRFDFSSPAVLHLGRHAKHVMAALAIGLVSAYTPHLAAQPISQTPIVHIASDKSDTTPSFDDRDGLTESAYAARTKRLNAMESKLSVEREAFRTAAEAKAQENGIGTCFGGFLNGHSKQNAVELSTVMVVTVNRQGTPIQTGSGVVVQNSLDKNGHNRLITARHIANLEDADPLPSMLHFIVASATTIHPQETTKDAVSSHLKKSFPEKSVSEIETLTSSMLKDFDALTPSEKSALHAAFHSVQPDHIEAYGSNGSYLGRFETIAMGRPNGGQTDENGEGPYGMNADANDWGVLGFAEPENKMAAAALDAIPGLPLAPIQAVRKSIGMSGNGTSPAVTEGYSGGPMVDASGYVHAITSALLDVDDPMMPSATLNHMTSPSSLNAKLNLLGGPVLQKQASFPVFKPTLGNPLGDPELLKAIGQAGQGIKTSPNAPLMSGKLQLTMVGMPLSYCAATSTVQGDTARPMPDTRERAKNTPAPYEIREIKGARMVYDGNGKIMEATLPNGTVKSYEDGILVSELHEDGTRVEFEDGKIVMVTSPEGEQTPYENGKPVKHIESVAVRMGR